MKIVKVIWKDAKCMNSNLTIDEVIKEQLIITETYGCLINENKERIAISSTIFNESNGSFTYRDIALIPKSQIIKIIELK